MAEGRSMSRAKLCFPATTAHVHRSRHTLLDVDVVCYLTHAAANSVQQASQPQSAFIHLSMLIR